MDQEIELSRNRDALGNDGNDPPITNWKTAIRMAYQKAISASSEPNLWTVIGPALTRILPPTRL